MMELERNRQRLAILKGKKTDAVDVHADQAGQFFSSENHRIHCALQSLVGADRRCKHQLAAGHNQQRGKRPERGRTIDEQQPVDRKHSHDTISPR